VIGQIEGHMQLPPQNKATKYEHIIPQLVAIEQNPNIKGLLLVLNTVGGDVEAGLAIAEMVASMDKPSVTIVLGGGHSEVKGSGNAHVDVHVDSEALARLRAKADQNVKADQKVDEGRHGKNY